MYIHTHVYAFNDNINMQKLDLITPWTISHLTQKLFWIRLHLFPLKSIYTLDYTNQCTIVYLDISQQCPLKLVFRLAVDFSEHPLVSPKMLHHS